MHAATIAEEHDKVATIYSDLGEAHGKIRNQDQAKEYHEKALIIWRKIYAEENPDVASNYNNLGNVHCSLVQYKETQD